MSEKNNHPNRRTSSRTKKNRIHGPINRFWPPNKRITCAHISLHSAKSQGKVKAEMKKICLLTILGLFVIAEAKPQNNQGNNIQWNEERQERPPAQHTVSADSPTSPWTFQKISHLCLLSKTFF